MKTRHKYSLAAAVVAALSAFAPVAHALDLGFFADVDYSNSNKKDEAGAFALGQFDIYGTHRLNDQTRAFFEYVIESGDEGFVLDLERLFIARQINGGMEVAVGRFHTPLGYWNRTYHHGALLYDTASRPGFLDFEDGEAAILPTHIVGLTAMGEVAVGGGGLSYDLFLANGPSLHSADCVGAGCEIEMNNVSDANESKSLGGALVYQFGNLPLRAGLSAMSNNIAESAPTGTPGALADQGEILLKQTIIGVEFGYERNGLELQAEYFRLINDAKVSGPGFVPGSHSGAAYYAQIGYRLSKHVKPVYRYESVSFDAQDGYFSLLGTTQARHHVLALRYDLDDNNALKFEVNRELPTIGDAINRYTIQWAFMLN